MRQILKPVTILHTADLHLTGRDQEWLGEGTSEQGLRTLEALVDAAERYQADLLLVSGDLFDTYHPSEEVVSFVLEQFFRLTIPAILIPGNHDCLGEARVFHSPDWKQPDLRPYVITDPQGETLEHPDLPIVVWGRGMVEHSLDFKPLDGLPARDGRAWHVAMAHGFFYDGHQRIDRSSPILASEIGSSGWDYIALGHKHIPMDISQGTVKAAYCGSPIGLWGGGRQALLVRLDERSGESVSLDWVPLAS